MQSLLKKYYNVVYFSVLLACSAAIIWGNFIITLCCIVLTTFWICNGNYFKGLKTALKRKSSLCLLLICTLILARFIPQLPHPDAVRCIEKYIPSFLFVFILASQKETNHKIFHAILLVYLFSIVINTLFCVGQYVFNFTNTAAFRSIGYFMSYIRLSLFTLLGCVVCVYYLFYNTTVDIKKNERIFLWIALIWLVCFVLLSKTITAYIAFSVLLVIFIFDQIRKHSSTQTKIILLSFLGIGVIGTTIFLYSEARYFLSPDVVNIASLDEKTSHGNKYNTFTKGVQLENGHWANLYVCDHEIDSCWQERTGMNTIWELNKDGFAYYHTLCRYMTSKNLRKDADGFAQLTDNDIENVKNGFTNYRFTSNFSPKKRFYEAFWEIHSYTLGDDPDGHSITQRWEFLKCAKKVMCIYPWFGAGAFARTEMFKFYEQDATLEPRHWNLPHNQFILMGVTTGVVGLIIFVGCFIGLFFFSRKKWNALTLGWFIITLISFFSEDTMNTYAGLAFCTYFGSLILFVQPENN